MGFIRLDDCRRKGPISFTRPPTRGHATSTPPASPSFHPVRCSPSPFFGCPPRPPNPNPSSVLSSPHRIEIRNPSFPDRWGGGRSAAWRPWPRRAAGSSSISSSIPPPVSPVVRPVWLARSDGVRPSGVPQLVPSWAEINLRSLVLIALNCSSRLSLFRTKLWSSLLPVGSVYD